MNITKEHIQMIVVNIITGTVIEIYLTPESISENYQALFTGISIMGRSSPLQGYGGGGPKNVSFSVVVHDDLCPEGILTAVNKFKALPYPEYDAAVIPPNCYVRIGDFIKLFGFCESVGVSWSPPYRKQKRDGKMVYMQANVDLSFTNCVQAPFSASSVEAGIDTDLE